MMADFVRNDFDGKSRILILNGLSSFLGCAERHAKWGGNLIIGDGAGHGMDDRLHCECRMGPTNDMLRLHNKNFFHQKYVLYLSWCKLSRLMLFLVVDPKQNNLAMSSINSHLACCPKFLFIRNTLFSVSNIHGLAGRWVQCTGSSAYTSIHIQPRKDKHKHTQTTRLHEFLFSTKCNITNVVWNCMVCV